MTARDLLSGPITLSAAIANGRNLVHAFEYPKLKVEFYARIERQRSLLQDVVAHHLKTNSTHVDISPQEYWRHGSFNLVVPVAIDSGAGPGIPEMVVLRFPLPYRVGELLNPGNSDEKINCEAATYAWIQQNCRAVPIPQLYGFGTSTNERFTHLNFLPWWLNYFHRFYRRVLGIFGFEQPSFYVPHPSHRLDELDTGYLLIQTITDGEMLSETWEENHDGHRLQNLQRDLARIMLSLSRTPLPRIGAFRMDPKGYLRLDNRPLSVQGVIQENEGIPLDLSRRRTFSRVNDFVSHQIDALDDRLLHQPNAIVDKYDAWYQMSSLAAARAIFPRMFRKELNSGPFVYALTDLHRSNIFVDEDWNVTCIIDLEYASSWPIEFVQPPYWLSGQFVDLMTPLDFAPKHAEFVEHVQKEERGQLQHPKNYTNDDFGTLSCAMQHAWSNGVFWATVAFVDPIGFTGVFYNSILPFYYSYSKEEDIDKADYRFFSLMWRPNASEIVDKKLCDRESYLESLHMIFADT